MSEKRSPTVIPMADLRARPGAVVDRLGDGRPIFLSRRGRTCAVILSIAAYDELSVREPVPVEVVERPAFQICKGDEAERVFQAVKNGARYPDDVVVATGLTVQMVLVALLELELNQRINPMGLGRLLSVR